MIFEMPEILITKFGVQDVLTVSAPEDDDETDGIPGKWD